LIRVIRVPLVRVLFFDTETEMKHAALTDQIIAAFYQVYNTLGWGFLEKVYHAALLHELRKRGLTAEANAKFDVYYDGVQVGEYFTDILVEGLVILELKAVERLADTHETQLVNYLKASGIEVGLALNFGPKPQLRRKVFDHTRPKPHSPADLADDAPDTDDPADGYFR
jgi:GxxExxY protein